MDQGIRVVSCEYSNSEEEEEDDDDYDDKNNDDDKVGNEFSS